MRVLLELLRIIFIFVLLGAIGWGILSNIYNVNPATESYARYGAVAIFILLFVLYRNKLQFSGWYKGKSQKKLPRIFSVTLISTSVLLIIMPFVLSFIVG